METIDTFLAELVGILWGPELVTLLIGGGLFFSFYLGGIQFRAFRHAIDVVRGRFDQKDDPGEINHFRALCTALSGTVGLGNIAGVAVAIKVGGPGATVWMIFAGLIGMATKYAECTLAVKFRQIDEHGVVRGGAMYYIEQGLGPKFKPLSYMFAFCCIFGAFGAACMFQTNQVAAIFLSSFNIPPLATGIVLAVLTGLVIIGGIRRIGNVAGKLVPFMAVSYVFACLAVIFTNLELVPSAFMQIFTDAFLGTAAVGGFTGAVVREVLIQGVRRAAFSNEAGLGTAAIAHSAAKTSEPVREGVVALLEPFIDTVVICTMTALVINITGVWQGELNGVELTAAALDHGISGLGTYFIPIAVFCFAYSSLISWSYYGERSIEYLFGSKCIIGYKVLFCILAVVGAVWTLTPVLNFSDSMVALMVLPNMIAMLLLAPTIKRETKSYFARLKAGEFS